MFGTVCASIIRKDVSLHILKLEPLLLLLLFMASQYKLTLTHMA